MRIPSVKIIRRILIGVIGAVALAALMNYLLVAMRRPPDDGKRPPMISADLRRAAEGLEVFVRKGSELRFTVRARRLRETIQDRNYLEGIEASDFNSDGSVRNSIHSERAVYDPGRKMLDFDGNVQVFLSDGIELRAEALYYDLNTEVGIIPGKMEFLSSNVSGRARDVRFFRDEDRLELGGEVDFSLTHENIVAAAERSGNAFHAAAASGMCLLSENRILFSGDVRIESPDMGILSTDAVDIKLNSDRSKITYMTASGETANEMRSHDGTRSVSGGRMVFTAGITGALEKALISDNANLLIKSADGEQTLRAGEIEVFLNSTTGAISGIRGTTGADLRDRRGSEETLAIGDSIYAEFADTGGRLRNMRLSGSSRLALKGTGNAANELRADTIVARFRAESDGIENLTADGGVRLAFEPPGSYVGRTLLASNLEIRYAGNYPETGDASGAVIIEESDAAARMTRRLEAERMRFDFFPNTGQIKSLIVDDGVRTVYERAASAYGNSDIERYQTFSDKLEASFVMSNGTGALWRATQRGNFRFISDGRSATADRGEYDADTGKLTLTGSPEIRDESGRVSGDRMEYDLTADEFLARGRVRAVLDARQGKAVLFQGGFQPGGGASPVVVTAEELRYRTAEERFQFSGGVMALTESQQLAAREITIDGGGNMTADGDILHRIHEADSGSAAAAAIIESGRMEYRRGEGIIRYFVNVEMKSKELAFSADTLNVTLDDKAKDVRRVLAGGNVLVRNENRICRGDAAEWVPAASRYIVTGNPAMIDDPSQGRATARRLTYSQVEDRVTLEP
jgi:lipopolysaccharide export system protein LptA